MAALSRFPFIVACAAGLSVAGAAWSQASAPPADPAPAASSDLAPPEAAPTLAPAIEDDLQTAERAGVVFERIRAPFLLGQNTSASDGPLSCDSKLAALLDNPTAHAVLERRIPDVVSSPQVSMARGLTLKQLAGFRQAGITPADLAAIDEDLASATRR